jgi:hypothetical protein
LKQLQLIQILGIACRAWKSRCGARQKPALSRGPPSPEIAGARHPPMPLPSSALGEKGNRAAPAFTAW